MTPSLHIDGQPASVEALTHQALVNYGAYTSFRVEGGGARGLDLHLQRLRDASIELFGETVEEDRLRDWVRAAAAGRNACWLRVSLFSQGISNRDPTRVCAPQVMIGVFDPPPPLADGLRLQVQTHERFEAHLKHAASMDLLRARRRARSAGFDDALFADRDGRISEGTLWNIGLVEGETVLWPQAPMLAGVTQRLIDAGLSDVGLKGESRPVARSELGGFNAAFICNSATPASAVTALDGRTLAANRDLIDRLRAAWASNPVQPI